jgi:hypothetical protein
MKKLLKKMIKNVETSRASIYSKDDVLSMLEDLKSGNDFDTDTEDVTEEDIEDWATDEKKDALITILSNKLNNLEVTDFVVEDNCQYEVDFDNKIRITSIDVDFSTIIDDLVEDIIAEVK